MKYRRTPGYLYSFYNSIRVYFASNASAKLDCLRAATSTSSAEQGTFIVSNTQFHSSLRLKSQRKAGLASRRDEHLIGGVERQRLVVGVHRVEEELEPVQRCRAPRVPL